MKVLGYDFITKESVRLIRPKDLVIDDVAVVRRNSSSLVTKLFAACRKPELSPSPLVPVAGPARSTSAAADSRHATNRLKTLATDKGDKDEQRRHSEIPGAGGLIVQRCVVIAKEADGYGLTVTGDHPVFVQTAKEDGAAFRAGVRQGDRILKVNGMPVTSSNHLEVVRMITGGQTVALTLLGRPPDLVDNLVQSCNNELVKPPKPKESTKLHSFLEAKPIITGPQPIAEEKREEWRRKRIHIISQMLDEERRHLEELRQGSSSSSSSSGYQLQVEQAERRIKNLESQLNDIDSPAVSTPGSGAGSGGSAPASLKNEDQVVMRPSSAAATKTVRISAPAGTSSKRQGESTMEGTGMHFVQPQQVDVVPMEEETDDDDAETVVPLDTQGPFSNLIDLKARPAHLAVFINYLLCNASPNSLFFYLITDIYQNSGGTTKELRKWAYEIFSTFLIPNAPLSVPNIEQPIVQAIDKVLSSPASSEQDDQLKRLFIAARQISVDDANDHLTDFRQKRQIGLGTVFDRNMLAGVVVGDRVKELKVADTLLMPGFERLFSGSADFESLETRSQALACALGTVIKLGLCLRPSCNVHEKLLDKCPTFVTKDKSGKFKIKSMASKRSVQVKGHQFLLNSVNVTVYCYHCREAVWGINAQAYFCTNCDVVLHKQCTGALTDSCYPAQTQKGKQPTKTSKPRGIQQPMSRDSSGEYSGSPPRTATGIIINEEGLSQESGEELDKTTDLRVRTDFHGPPGAPSISSDSGIGADLSLTGDKPVARSQSMRTREDEQRESKRGRAAWDDDAGDVGGQRRAKSDVDADDKSIALAIRRGAPVEIISGATESVSGSSSISHASIGEEEARRMLERVEKSAIAEGDSDLEIETEIPQLDSIINWETIRHLKPKEKKRQEVVNELFHTERTHVRNLKILYRVFYTPLLVQQIIPPDLVKLLFANIDDILELHVAASKAMRAAANKWRNDQTASGLFGEIGQLMLDIFDGEAGERLRRATAAFCQHQQYALDALRSRCKKDEALSKFLVEAESNTLCRKLQLKDMLPVEMQRLVKYPLLLETIAKYTPETGDEQEKLRRAIDLSKNILSIVNSAKRNAENLRRLDDLQKRLDTTPFDKESLAIAQDYRNMDLRKFRLVHDGSLTWRFNKGKMVELHVVLLESLLVLFTKGGDGHKLILRCQEPNKDTRWVPVLPLGPLITKEKANDKKSFFIVNNSPYGAQIYEMVAATATERKTWFKVISDQIEVVNRKGGRASHPTDATLNDSGVSDASQGEDDHGGDRVHVITHPRLVNANEIEVLKPTVLEHARPVLTPGEQLRRDDQIILSALLDKQRILAEALPGNSKVTEELDKIADQFSGMSVTDLKQRDTKEIALSAIVQGNRLLDAINEGMNLKKQEQKRGELAGQEKIELAEQDLTLPTVACYRLTGIAAPLMNHLKAMMQVVQEQQEELKTVRSELHHYKEMAERRSNCSVSLRSGSDETLTGSTTAEGSGSKSTSPSGVDEHENGRRKSDVDKDDKDAEAKRKERLLHKRQRNAALVGGGDPRTSPEKTA